MPDAEAGAASRARRRPVRSGTRVVRVGDQVAFVVFDLWCTGAITVPVPTLVLQRALGLAPDELAGARATAVINADALLDHEVQPRAWRPASPAARGQQPSDGNAAAPPGPSAGAADPGGARPVRIPAPRTRGSRP